MIFDPLYLLFMLPALLLGMWAQSKVQSAYRKYRQVSTGRGYTGYQAAREILDRNGLQGVEVQEVSGELTDHYDPRSNVVSLSTDVYRSNTVAAIGIASHECGHAIQHAEGYGPLRLRNAIIPLTNIGSSLAIPLILLGWFLNMANLITIGLIAYALIAVFQMVTLPVEYNASNRAMEIIASNSMVTAEEQKGVKKVLNAAALTYVAALVTSLAQFLYLFMRYGGRSRSSRD